MHEHCKNCGTCLINGYTITNHPCQQPIDPEVKAVMEQDMLSTAQKSRLRYREFQRVEVQEQ